MKKVGPGETKSSVSSFLEGSLRQRLRRAWLILGGYFALFILVEPIIGPFVSITAFLPALAWALLLGRYAGLLLGIMLFIPNYFLIFLLGGDMARNAPFLGGGHLLIAAVSYVVGSMHELRGQLAHQLAERAAGEARYRALFDHTHDAILLLDLDLKIEAVNDRAARMLGFSVDEMVGMHHHNIVLEEERSELKDRLQQLLSGERLPIYERTFLRKDASQIRVEVDAALIFDSDGHPHYVQSICRDITDRKRAEEKLYHQASHDALTGLYNRLMFYELLQQAMERAKRNEQKVALLFMDLDGFKQVNDTLGHAVTDRLLQEVASRLKSRMRASDPVARIGGDEFVIILEGIQSRAAARDIAASVEQELGLPYYMDGNKAFVAASVGVALYPDDTLKPDELVGLADERMYAIKDKKQQANQPNGI
jgi:diguanylate cyclase (GGDEF)-like protein/PAS domain S-box-containing protein